jgi:hypothetical protein
MAAFAKYNRWISQSVILSPSPPVTLSETKGLVFGLRINSAKDFVFQTP